MRRRLRNLGPITAGASWIGLHAYAARPLMAMNPHFGWAAALLAPAISILPLFARRSHPERLRSAAHWVGYATMSVFAALLVVTVGSDIARLIMPWSRAASAATIVAALSLTLIGLVQARRPRIVSIDVSIDDLPPALEGYRIVQWSDVHVGPTIRRNFVRSLVDRTNALDADAIAITGDLIDGHLADLRDEVAPLADLRARDGVFYVTGNHEYYWRASEWLPELQRLGLTFLKNEHRVIERDGAQLAMVGVTDPAGRYSHKTDPAKAFSGVPADATKILLAHRPQHIAGAHLQLSGHTHGGQFFPFNLFIRWFQPVVRGLHRVDGSLLYVSRGTGYWGPPSRLGVGGEITVLTLRSQRV